MSTLCYHLIITITHGKQTENWKPKVKSWEIKARINKKIKVKAKVFFLSFLQLFINSSFSITQTVTVLLNASPKFEDIFFLHTTTHWTKQSADYCFASSELWIKLPLIDNEWYERLKEN